MHTGLKFVDSARTEVTSHGVRFGGYSFGLNLKPNV
jgi:hypothetical protein